MREEIQQFIAEGRTEEALALLAKHNSDATLLQARYNQAKKQQNMGMIDFGEWLRVQSQVNMAALEMASSVRISNTVHISNVSNSHINIGVNTSSPMNVTINFNSAHDFQESLNQLDLPTLVQIITAELTGKPAMLNWLPIKQEYDSFKLLGRPIPPGYIGEIKQKLIKIYDEHWTKVAKEKENRIKSAVQAIYDGLIKDKTEDTIRTALEDFQIFFYENPNINHRNKGVEQMESFEKFLDSGQMKLYKAKREDSYSMELDKIHSELVTISNRILLSLEK